MSRNNKQQHRGRQGRCGRQQTAPAKQGRRTGSDVDRVVRRLGAPPAPRVGRVERQGARAEERERRRVAGAVVARLQDDKVLLSSRQQLARIIIGVPAPPG